MASTDRTRLDHRQFPRQLHGVHFCHVLAVCLAFSFWGPLIDASWGLTDDHEIMLFVGNQDRLPLARVASTLEHTEVGSSSTLARFRPAYYTLRIAEAAAWGKEPALWYAVRIGIAALLGITLAHLCVRFAGPLLTAAFLVFALSQPYWRDIFARAGPGETYCVLGACLVALGWGTKMRTAAGAWPVFFISLGTLIAAGSKENFLILGALPLWLLLTHEVRLTRAGRWMCIGTLAILAWIGITVVGRLHISGMDVYNNDASLLSRLKLAGPFFLMPAVQLWLAAISLFAWVGWFWRADGNSGSAAIPSASPPIPARGYCIALCILLAIYAFQYLFYAGKWPDGAYERYLFPGMLAFDLALLVGATALTKLAANAIASPPLRLACKWLVFSAFLIQAHDSFTANRLASVETVRATQKIERNFQLLTDQLRNYPAISVIINSHDIWDLEPAIAVSRFLKAYGFNNPVAIRISGYSPARFPTSSFESNIASVMERLSRGEGSDAAIATASKNDIVAFSTISQTDCISVGLSGPPLATCRGGVRMWPN